VVEIYNQLDLKEHRRLLGNAEITYKSNTKKQQNKKAPEISAKCKKALRTYNVTIVNSQ